MRKGKKTPPSEPEAPAPEETPAPEEEPLDSGQAVDIGFASEEMGVEELAGSGHQPRSKSERNQIVPLEDSPSALSFFDAREGKSKQEEERQTAGAPASSAEPSIEAAAAAQSGSAEQGSEDNDREEAAAMVIEDQIKADETEESRVGDGEQEEGCAAASGDAQAPSAELSGRFAFVRSQ
eukprot:3038332-Rhodomonas_salina.4